jgi:hypothetical protein
MEPLNRYAVHALDHVVLHRQDANPARSAWASLNGPSASVCITSGRCSAHHARGSAVGSKTASGSTLESPASRRRPCHRPASALETAESRLTRAHSASTGLSGRQGSRLGRQYDFAVGYPYEDLDDSQFERLVVECMRKLFGAGVQSFAPGKDGGRDALFVGVAERFPSAAAPWTGITIGQAKHTHATNGHFSDPDFSSEAKSSVLTKEAERVAKLVKAGQIGNYILFANRRAGGVTVPTLVARFAAATGLAEDRIVFVGVEYIDDLLRRHPELLELAKIDPLDGPLLVSSYELAEVILLIATELKAPLPEDDAPIMDRVSFAEKNRVSHMSPGFADLLSKRYLSLTRRIGDFLAEPANEQALRHYEAAVEDFQLKIVAKRAHYQSFDDVFNYLVDLLVKRDSVLARNVRLVRAMLFYMYWHCDIGATPDAATA